MRMLLAVLLLTCCALSYAGPRAQGVHAGPLGWQSLDTAEAAPRTRPMLVYFGAEWCAPCKVLETQVFNQSDIAEAMRALIPVYIDGDGDGAAALMDRFKVMVFPTLLMIDPSGKETGRFVGSSDKSEVLTFLGAARKEQTPIALLDAVTQGASLSPAQWGVLATLGLQDASDLEYQDEAVKAAYRIKRAKLAKAVAAARSNRTASGNAGDILAFKLIYIDALTDKPAGETATQRAALRTVLARPELAAQVRSELIEYAEALLDYLAPEGDQERPALAKRLMAAQERFFLSPATIPSSRLTILETQLALLPLTSDDIDADKTRIAERAEAELKAVRSTTERLALVQSVARTLRRTGRELRAEAVLREALAQAPEAFYLVGTLSAYAKMRGDREGQLQLSERAYRMSLGRTDGMGYGLSWLTALIDVTPKDTARISTAADEVLDHAITAGDAYLGWKDETMHALANRLGTWMATGEKPGAAVADRVKAKFRSVCESLRADAEQAEACSADIALLDQPNVDPPKS